MLQRGQWREYTLVIYNIPFSLLQNFREENLIVRSAEPQSLIDTVHILNGDQIFGLQLLGLQGSPDVFRTVEGAFPLEIVIEEIPKDILSLKEYQYLLEKHDVWVSIPAVSGCADVGKEILRLGFSLRLNLGQPEQKAVEDMSRLLDFFLRTPEVSQPVEPFLGLFTAFFQGQPVYLWSLQREHPEEYLFVTDKGEVKLSGRLPTAEVNGKSLNFLDEYKFELLMSRDQCSACKFFTVCEGYFKTPDKGYNCDAILIFFESVKRSAFELRQAIDQSNKSM